MRDKEDFELALRNCFNDGIGQVALEAIAQLAGQHTSSYPGNGDAVTAVYNEGRRSLYLDIVGVIERSNMQLKEDTDDGSESYHADLERRAGGHAGTSGGDGTEPGPGPDLPWWKRLVADYR